MIDIVARPFPTNDAPATKKAEECGSSAASRRMAYEAANQMFMRKADEPRGLSRPVDKPPDGGLSKKEPTGGNRIRVEVLTSSTVGAYIALTRRADRLGAMARQFEALTDIR